MANKTIGGLSAAPGAPNASDLVEGERDPSGTPSSEKLTWSQVAASSAFTSAFAAAGHDHDGTYQPLDADLTALAAAGNSSVLAATTASFTSADESKLDGIEASADVTDQANVAAAGAPIVVFYTEATASTATRPITGGTVLWVNTDGTTLPTNGDTDDIVLRNSGA